ncbi:hypothetical protein QNM99_05420 [Pseudomonas sp. PCH446]
MLHTRERLQALYAQPLPAEQMRGRKAAEFERLRRSIGVCRRRSGRETSVMTPGSTRR